MHAGGTQPAVNAVVGTVASGYIRHMADRIVVFRSFPQEGSAYFIIRIAPLIAGAHGVAAFGNAFLLDEAHRSSGRTR